MAKKAGKVLNDDNATKREKSLAGSVLSQAAPSKSMPKSKLRSKPN